MLGPRFPIHLALRLGWVLELSFEPGKLACRGNPRVRRGLQDAKERGEPSLGGLGHRYLDGRGGEVLPSGRNQRASWRAASR
jgi:hypothetical protein